MQDLKGLNPSASPGKTQPPRRGPREPRLLVDWESRRKIFCDNVVDRLLFREPTQPWQSSRPAEFWPDVFVDQRLPWRRISGSGILHVLAVGLVYVITLNWPQRPLVKQLNEGTTITYYNPSEYLPEIDTGKRAEPKPRHGQPALAKQHIRSMPPAPDNFRQTIVTPDPMKIQDDVPLPNLAVNTTIPAPPEAAVLQPNVPLSMAQIAPVAPPPSIDSLRTPVFAPPAPEVVAPPVDPSQVRAKIKLPNVPGPEVVGPPPSLDAAVDRTRLNVPAPSVVGPPVGGDVSRPLGAMNMARADLAVAAPKLAAAPQQAVMTIRSASGSGGRSSTAAGAQPTPPSVTAVSAGAPGMRNAGQLIALSVHPVMPNGPITVPKGSRSGEFEAGPEGKPGAPGTPNVPAGSGDGASGNGHGTAGPPGITVSPGPSAAATGPVVASTSPPPPVAKPPVRMLPSLRPMSVADIARSTRPIPPIDSSTEKPDEVFGTKKYYSMTLNMPSVTSAGGSCIIRFAELKEQRIPGDLTAPIAMLKVDPAYPPEEIRDHVEGTVTLYAVIHKDGTVGEVRVLHGVDATLDHNASVALSHWQFRPATRNGSAVDLEAVVQIPFIAKRKAF